VNIIFILYDIMPPSSKFGALKIERLLALTETTFQFDFLEDLVALSHVFGNLILRRQGSNVAFSHF